MSRKIKRGFTLIELLVVIAIIGVLASVVLVSVQSARKKGNDTRVIAGVQQLRNLIESSYVNNTFPELTGSVRVALPGTGKRLELENDIIAQQKAGGLTGLYGATSASPYFVAAGTLVITKTSNNPAKGYAIYAKLPSGGVYCLDGEGRAKTNADATAGYPTGIASGNYPGTSDTNASTCRP